LTGEGDSTGQANPEGFGGRCQNEGKVLMTARYVEGSDRCRTQAATLSESRSQLGWAAKGTIRGVSKKNPGFGGKALRSSPKRAKRCVILKNGKEKSKGCHAPVFCTM